MLFEKDETCAICDNDAVIICLACGEKFCADSLEEV